MEVIHDWDDAAATAILTAVRTAAPSGATVLIIEAASNGDRHDARLHTLDVIMLAITGGRERSATQLTQLLEAAGLVAVGVHHTPGTLHIVEAKAA